ASARRGDAMLQAMRRYWIAVLAISLLGAGAVTRADTDVPPTNQAVQELSAAQRANADAQADYYRQQAAKMRAASHESSLPKLLSGNPTAMIGAVAAALAALTTIVTFVFNYRFTIRSQTDTQFYEALRR